MVVILNNGTRIKIDTEGAQAIAQNLLSEKAMQWQCQLNTGDKNIIHLFNLKEVSAICREEDVL